MALAYKIQASWGGVCKKEISMLFLHEDTVLYIALF